MKCKVKEFYLNIRYRALDINNERYILDMGGSSLWRLFFPFLYWMLPLRAYHVEDDQVINKLTTPHQGKTSIGFYGLFGGGVSFILGNSLYPLVQYLDVEITSVTSALIMFVIFILIAVFYIYLNTLLGKKLHKAIDLTKLPEEKVWVRPKSTIFIFQIFLFYFFALAISVGFVTAVIQLPNGFMFFASSLVLFLTLLIGFFTIRTGETTVQFKR